MSGKKPPPGEHTYASLKPDHAPHGDDEDEDDEDDEEEEYDPSHDDDEDNSDFDGHEGDDAEGNSNQGESHLIEDDEDGKKPAAAPLHESATSNGGDVAAETELAGSSLKSPPDGVATAKSTSAARAAASASNESDEEDDEEDFDDGVDNEELLALHQDAGLPLESLRKRYRDGAPSQESNQKLPAKKGKSDDDDDDYGF